MIPNGKKLSFETKLYIVEKDQSILSDMMTERKRSIS